LTFTSLLTMSSGPSRPLPELNSVLVVGGCGFLGHQVVKAFLAHLSKPVVSVSSRNPTVNRVEGATYYTGDATNSVQLLEIISKIKPRVVINTASILPPTGSSAIPDPKVYFEVNVKSALEVHPAAKFGTFSLRSRAFLLRERRQTRLER
jgi:sterol-4alpha-carboxylate 3-dehydrogenase (decarboxylating)